MNKHLHRIVFNAARGLRMVVQETARSTGRGARKATGGGAGVGSAAVSVAAIAGALMSAPLHAQIVADPGAPGGQRPTVLGAPNGVPVVNIQTPSAAGVSRNTYSQFDVQRNGVVLNNSRGNVQTQLGGWVQGNPWLATGPARVILNEVNSANPSQLRGYVEVAGPRTEVIIANPAGIQVDGGGFINVNRATLTSGTPQFNAQGGLHSFVVRGGTVSIDGAGLDAAKTDYAAILARAVQVNAGLWANELKVVAGANQVSADSSQTSPTAGNGAAPSFALDVAALGGMYAGKITLVGTEAGVGVRNAGHIGAGAGGLVVTAAGRLENTGTLEGAKVELSSASDIDNRGGTIRQAGTRDISVTAPVLSNTQGGFIGAEPVATSTGSGGDAGTSAGTSSESDAGSGSSGATPSTTTGTTTAAAAAGIAEALPVQPPAATGAGAITAAGSILNDGGKVFAGGPIALQTPNVNNDGGTLNVASMALNGHAFSNAGGTLNVTNVFAAHVGTFNNAGGQLQAGSVAIATTGDLNNQGGTLASGGTADLSVGGGVNNTSGTVSAVGALSATVAGTLDNTSGKVVGNKALNLAAGSLNNTLGAVQSAGSSASLSVANEFLNARGSVGAATDLSIRAGSLAQSGTLRAENDSTINVAGAISNNGSITSGRSTTIAAGSLSGGASGVLGAGIKSDGTLGASGDLAANTTGSFQAAGTLLAAGDISVQGASTDLTGSRVSAANVSLAATQGHVTTSDATITTPGRLTLTANTSAGQSLVNDSGVLSAGQLNLQASNLQNTHEGQIVQTGTGATTIAVTGTLDNTAGLIASNGQDLGLGASTLRNTGGAIQHAGNGTLDIDVATFSGANGTVVGNGDLVIAAGTFNQDGANTSAKRITIDASDISNRAGTIVQTGAAATHIAATASLVNDGGTIATNGADLSLSAGTLSNASGHLQHAGNGTFSLDADGYSGAAGEVVTNGALVANFSGAFNQDGGTTSAKQLTLNAGSLGNRGGQIVQTDTDTAHIGVIGVLDNSANGTIASNGDLSIASGSLINQGGRVRTAGTAALEIRTSGLLDNSLSGAIGSSGDFVINVGRLSNDAGSVTAVGDLHAAVAGAASNVSGTLAANGNTTVSAASLDNTRGTVAAVAGDLAVTTTGLTSNTQGSLQAAGNVALVNAGLVNTQGKVTGNTLSVNTNGAALTNTLGTLAATTTVDLQSGGLNNDRGLVQSGGAMAVDTHGQSLTNTNATGHSSGQGGIASGGALALSAGAVDNTVGFIGAKDKLTASTGGLTNAAGGLVLGQSDVAIATNGGTYDNRGGKTLAQGDLAVNAGGGTVLNSGALVRSAQTTTIAAGYVDNTATLGADQGIEGQNVAIGATNLNNNSGAVRADANATVTSSGIVSNANGLMSAGDTLAILDPNRANPGAKSLSMTNTGGTLTANKSLQLDAAIFSADGTLTSGQDLSISLTQNLVNNATVSANRNLTYATTGTLTNNGKLLAGQVLTVSGSDVENTASGEMRGDTTIVNAGGTLTNRGLIDGHDTRINAGALVNASTGRIYGDYLSIAAGSVLNDADGTSAGTIAARDTLDVGTGSLTNRDGALIFSAGDIHIGGALDANRQAVGTAALVENKAATIEALGDVHITASTLNNLNGGVTWSTTQQSQQVVEFTPSGSNLRFKADEVLTVRLASSIWGVYWVAVPASDTGSSTRLLIPSPTYPLAKFAAYYAESPGLSSDFSYETCGGGDNSSCYTMTTPGKWYGASDPIWATFGVAAPVRDLPADSAFRLDRNATVGQIGIYGLDGNGYSYLVQSFAHPVTQAEYDEAQAYYAAHASLDVATQLFAKVVYAGTDNTRDPDGPPNGFYRDYTRWNYTVTTESPVLETSKPGKILAGGDMTLTVGAGTNRMSQILAGRGLTVTGGAIANEAVEVQAATVVSGSAYNSYVKNGSRRFDATAYSPASTPVTVTLAGARQEGGINLASGQAPEGAQAIRVGAGTSAAGSVQTSHRVNPIIEVASAVGGAPGVTGSSASASGQSSSSSAATSGPSSTSASTNSALVVRTTTPDGTVPIASLFRTNAGATSQYLVETDPAFANYRNWASSDYLLGALAYDPATVTKRLGDGFYEQQLIREQVAQLTGYRYLAGANDDQSQYTALMNAGVTFAKEHHLTPGIALSAAQMAQLTSDIVWLVEQTVTLADGSTEKVLVPQVYVRVKPGDLDGSGALLSADAVIIKNEAGQGDLVNSGTIAGRTMVSITADNVQNLNGRITGGSVGVNARTDLNNIGGTIEAENSAVLTAGRDINIVSMTQTAVGAHSSATAIDRVAGVYVTNPGGTLIASAGNDVNLIGAILSNVGAGGVTSVTAGNDINLGTVKAGSSQETTWNANNYSRRSESAEVGSTIATNGTTVLNAGNDINIRQGNVDAGDGLLSVHAERDINITAGQSTQTADDARRNKSRGFLTSKTRTTRSTLDETISQGSSLSGGVVSVTANNNIAVEGSAISGTDGVLVHAGNVLSVYEARDTRSESNISSVKKSGLAGSIGGIPVPMGAGSRDATTADSNIAVASSITSTNGGVLLQGDGAVILQGVKVDAAKDITIQGGVVSITAATDYASSSSEHYKRGTNIGGSLWHDPGKGIDAKNTDLADRQASGLDRTTLSGANVSITATGADGTGGLLAMSGTTVNTLGTLTLSADTLILGTQTTQTDVSNTSQGGDWAWQKAKGEGSSDQTTQYNQFNVGQLATPVNSVQAGLGARDSIESLAQQPGMAWINQLNTDPKLTDKIDWVKVEEAHKNWDYSQQGLTPAAAAVVTLVVAYFTAGAASGAGTTAGNAAAVSAGEGVAMAGGGTFVTATGATISGVVGGAVTAGISTLATQAALAVINNRGDLGAALHDLGSSANVHSLLTAIATGGVLGGLNLNPTGLPTTGAGEQGLMAQLGQNLQAGAARAVVNTAINGGSLEDSLKDSIKTAFIDTLAAQGANQIGNWTQEGTLNEVANKIAHAIAGCAIGAAKADNSGGCGPGALGAAIGELSAELYGRNIDTVQFASMMSGIAAAIAGGDAAAINLASQTGANAAANNYLNHDQWKKLSDRLNSCVPGPDCDAVVSDFQKLSADQDRALVAACQDINSAACRATLAVAVEGTATQKALATAGKLPASYLAGGDFNANANLYAKSAFMSDLRTECARNPICDQKKTDSLLRLGSAALDFVPVIGDVKAYVEAESPFDYLLATLGIAGPVGDGVAKALREGRALYKAGDVAGSTAKLAEAKSLQEVATTIGAMPTGSGFINKTLLNKEASVLNTATLDQRTIISDVVANGDRTGVKTEALVNNVFSADPSITVLGGTKYGSNNGLDHVVQFIDPQTGKTMTMVIDSKQLSTRGTTGLDSSAAGAAMQLSDTSLQAVIERLGGTPAANAISDALDGGTLLKAVAYIDKKSGELKIVRVLN